MWFRLKLRSAIKYTKRSKSINLLEIISSYKWNRSRNFIWFPRIREREKKREKGKNVKSWVKDYACQCITVIRRIVVVQSTHWLWSLKSTVGDRVEGYWGTRCQFPTSRFQKGNDKYRNEFGRIGACFTLITSGK